MRWMLSRGLGKFLKVLLTWRGVAMAVNRRGIVGNSDQKSVI